MQREEKHLESSVEALINRVQEVKNSITTFLIKLEHEYEHMNWPVMLDNYALISGQISSLTRIIKNEKTPLLRNQVLLPLVLSPDRDTKLEKLTEGRVCAFNHEVVPDYLRTKPEPEVEDKINQLMSRSNHFANQEMIQKQINQLNKISSNMADLIGTTRDQWESELNKKYSQPQTSSQNDTNTLVSATTFGKGLKRHIDMQQTNQRQPSGHQEQKLGMHPSQGYSPHMRGYYGNMQAGGMMQGKAQSTIKTNIKSASSMHAHPYSRH